MHFCIVRWTHMWYRCSRQLVWLRWRPLPHFGVIHPSAHSLLHTRLPICVFIQLPTLFLLLPLLEKIILWKIARKLILLRYLCLPPIQDPQHSLFWGCTLCWWGSFKNAFSPHFLIFSHKSLRESRSALCKRKLN